MGWYELLFQQAGTVDVADHWLGTYRLIHPGIYVDQHCCIHHGGRHYADKVRWFMTVFVVVSFSRQHSNSKAVCRVDYADVAAHYVLPLSRRQPCLMPVAAVAIIIADKPMALPSVLTIAGC